MGIDLIGRLHTIEEHAEHAEIHHHTRGRWWGSNGAATETNAINANVDTPFVATSGNNTWGAAIPICGTADTPVSSIYTEFDPHRLLVTDTDHNTPYRFRIIWGTGTSAEAIAADQWSEDMFITASGPFLSGVASDVKHEIVDVGTKLWVQVWNATNGSTVSFFWEAHGYP